MASGMQLAIAVNGTAQAAPVVGDPAAPGPTVFDSLADGLTSFAEDAGIDSLLLVIIIVGSGICAFVILPLVCCTQCRNKKGEETDSPAAAVVAP